VLCLPAVGGTSVTRISLYKAAALCAFLLLCSPLHAQVSFFQPLPSAPGTFTADFNGDGKADLLTGNGTLSLGNGDGTFKLGTPVPGSPLAVADFNGDGKPDILEQGTGTLLILLGNGDGTFQAPVSTPSGANLAAVIAADLRGNGKVDVIGLFNGMLMIYLGKGDGTFASGVPYNTGTTLNNALTTVGDFNGDHKADIVVSTSPGSSLGQEIVFLGNGDGTFHSPVTSAGVYIPASVAVGDFNGDGKADLLINSGETSIGGSTIFPATYLLLGNGDGTFHASTIVFPGGGQVAALDLNGDGKLDIIFFGDASDLEIYLGNGDGTFSNTNNYALLPATFGIPVGAGLVIADFNLDGKMDIDAGGSVLLGNGNGTFQGVPLGLLPGFVPVAGPMVTGKFDKTSPPGVAIVGSQVSTISNFVNVFSNNGSAVLSLTHSYALQQPGLAMVTADFNGDGNLDLMVFSAPPNSGTWGYSVLLGNGDGSFQPATFVSLNTTSPPVFQPNNSVVVADFNGDKKLDVAVGGFGDHTLAILLGNGDGTFGAPSHVFDAGDSGLLGADFNSDGKMDIAASVNATTNGGTFLLFGNGDGTFQPAVLPANLNGFVAEFVGDFNNDGKPDLLFGIQTALGNGDGTFTVLPPPAKTYRPLQVADFNGDGKQDLLLGYLNGSVHSVNVAVTLGNGDGTFGSLIEIPPPENNNGIFPTFVVTDMNGDGRPDILLPVPVDSSSVGVAVLLNTTPAGFALAASALSPATVTAGGSATSTVTVSSSFGSNGSVTLSCVGLPSGASCQFSPASIAGASGTSSLTITTSGGAAAGTYPVKVQGTAGSLTTNATLSLVIQAPVTPDFTIAAPSPSSQTVAAGKSATFTLALAPSGSFSGTVNLSCAVTPAATRPPTCTLSSPSVQISGSGSQSVTATVATTAPTTTGAARPVDLPTPPPPLLWTLSLLSLAWLLLRYQKRQPILVPLLLVLASVSLAGCGGGSSSPSPIPGTPAGTYTVTVTASSGSSTHSATVQVVVQ
jgi:hypothetical protein